MPYRPRILVRYSAATGFSYPGVVLLWLRLLLLPTLGATVLMWLPAGAAASLIQPASASATILAALATVG